MIERVQFILIACLLQGALGREWAVWMPQSIEALSGSCVLIPCRFEIKPDFDKLLVPESMGIWKRNNKNGGVVFNSSLAEKNPEESKKGKLIGKLQEKNCTTILNNFTSNDNDKYLFRLVGSGRLIYTFEESRVQINAQDSPLEPKLTSEEVEVVEGTSVSLSCSAAAPCPKLPPNVTWTPRLGDSVDQLQKNEDKTTSVSSVLTFTASHLHHEQKITCSALYTLQQGNTEKTSDASLILRILYPPKNTSGSVSPSGSVLEGSSVTLTCSSKAKPPVQNYTWYKVNGTEINTVGTGQNLTFNVTESSDSEQYYCEAQNNYGMENSTTVLLIVDYPPKNTSVSVSPSSSVLEGSSVTLTCGSKANPPVQNYIWYKANETEINIAGTGQNLTINVTESSGSEQYYCEAQNEHGKENSTTVQLNVIYKPQISGSGSCSRTAAEISCSCESRGNPSPSMEWRVSGLRVTNSTDSVIREEQLGNTGLRSSLTMRHSQGDTPTLLCLSSNTLGSSSFKLHVPCPPQLSEQHSGFHSTSLLIGAAAGAGAMILICFIIQLIEKKARRQDPGVGMKDTEGLILAAGMASQHEVHGDEKMRSGPGAMETGDETALNYATVDFSKLHSTGGEYGSGIIRGSSQRTSDYAAIRHKSGEVGGGVEGGVEVQGEVEKEGSGELGGESETAKVKGVKKAQVVGESQPNPSKQASVNPEATEEATYGNICRSRPTKRVQQEPHRSPAPEEEGQREEEITTGRQEDMYVDVMSALTEGNGKGAEESEYAEVRKLH